MEYKFLGYAIVGLASVLLFYVCHALPTWLLKKYRPGAEWWVNAPISAVIARLGTAGLQAIRAARRPSQE